MVLMLFSACGSLETDTSVTSDRLSDISASHSDVPETNTKEVLDQIVEANTMFWPEAEINQETYKNEGFLVVKRADKEWMNAEYHCFEDDTCKGTVYLKNIWFQNPKPHFEEYNGHVWLILDELQTKGSGMWLYEQAWYDLSGVYVTEQFRYETVANMSFIPFEGIVCVYTTQDIKNITKEKDTIQYNIESERRSIDTLEKW